ncbi:glycosyl transferase [Marinobacterium nitratireducens]|uniref:Glycosyl transferase n=1 Tax=Marinobacterium nitratireducens TaxID=518897 RepID=A0A917ZCG4_9GAMM|nr:glycosyltransferase [Marinobacterium nitratireducens]GGO80288.1 glycosyl transferase [Marinobacterium nitratireducens]
MNLLAIGYVWPEPASSAAGYRMLALLDCFRRHHWNVTVTSPAEKSIHRADLPARGIREQSIALNCSSFDSFVREAQPDVVLFDRFMMEEQFGWRVEKHCPLALRILDTEDLSCLRHARHAAAKLSGEVTTDVAPERLFSDHAKREVAAILRSDLTLMISRAEIELLTSTFKVDPSLLHYTPFMLEPVDTEQQTQLPQRDQRNHFIAIGNFRHAPNWDAVLWLQQAIWPLIRRQLPEAELHIYGAYPPPKATAIDTPRQGFRIKGWAESASEVMKQARVNLAPLRFGAGLKGKLVDALACGTPSVTTSIGAEGMNDEHCTWPGPIADTPEAFADAAAELYQDPELWLQCQQQGFRLHNRHFAFESHADALTARVATLRQTLSQHRLNNFTGAMLRHHTMKSTQYMAQWIEAKNRHKND